MIQIIYEEFLDEIMDSHLYPEKKNAYLRLYARLFSSNCMTLLKWYFENDHFISTSEAAEAMHQNMKLGMFQAFRNYQEPRNP